MDDRRVITVRITAAGSLILEQLEQPIQELHQNLLGHVKKKKLEALTELLDVAREKAT